MTGSSGSVSHSPDDPGIGLPDMQVPNGIFRDEQAKRMYWTKGTQYHRSKK
jgi:hypothetical protein